MRRRTLAHLFNVENPSAGTASGTRGALIRLRGDKRGGAALITTMAATSLLGVAGLAVEVGNWYLVRRNMQAAADAAAIAGALKLEGSDTLAEVTTLARSIAERNGFAHSADNPVTVAYDAATGQVTVTVARTSTASLLHAAGYAGSTRTLTAQAVASLVAAGPPSCLLAETGSIEVHNNPSITASGCAIATNSPQANAFDIGNGQGTITAASLVSHGGCEGCESARTDGKLVLPSGVLPLTYAAPTPNPYADLANMTVPASLNCVAMPSVPKGGLTLQPGCYTSIDVRSNETVTMAAGVYYIRKNGSQNKDGILNIQGTITGTGVAMVLIGSASGGAPGVVDINGNASMSLQAGTQPTNSDLDGVLIYRHAPSASPGSDDISINGNATLQLRGAIVAPTSGLKVRGNSASSSATPTAASCNVFMVGSASFNGDVDWKLGTDGCDDYGVKDSKARIARLVQ